MPSELLPQKQSQNLKYLARHEQITLALKDDKGPFSPLRKQLTSFRELLTQREFHEQLAQFDKNGHSAKPSPLRRTAQSTHVLETPALQYLLPCLPEQAWPSPR